MNEKSGASRVYRHIDRTPEERARLKAARDRFQSERPSLDELVASGEYEGPVPLGVYRNLIEALAALKKMREGAGLSLADVSERSGIDRAAISRLENGHVANPTVDTLARYAAALGKNLSWAIENMESSA